MITGAVCSAERIGRMSAGIFGRRKKCAAGHLMMHISIFSLWSLQQSQIKYLQTKSDKKV
jgi:hypothetical protein